MSEKVGARARRWLLRRLPVLAWAPRYTRTAALADCVAGVTLGLTLVPQSIAYAALANLPVQHGLYSAFVGTMLYVLLGTVKEVSIGPTSLMALLTLQTCSGLPVEFVVLLTFLSGCVVLAMGLLRLGFMTDLISPAVTSGFTSATAVIIVAAQLKGMLGLSFVAESVPDNLVLIVRHAHRVRPPDCALAAACCAALLTLRKLPALPVSTKRRRLRKALWLVSIARNALVVLAASTLAYCTRDPAQHTHPLFRLSGAVEAGLPPLGAPPFSAPAPAGNGTVGFVEMVSRLGGGVLVVPVVMVLANIAIAKAFTVGGRVDATQEMLTLGLCNMAGSLVRAMPTCGAFTRSAVSHSSGVRTPLAGLYSGIITLLALAFMTEYFYYIPKACLSAVLICAVIFMVDVVTAVDLWRTSRGELLELVVTFSVGVLWSVEPALLCGALCGLARVVRRVMRPPVRELRPASGEARVLRPDLAMIYLNAEHVAARVHAHHVPPGARTLLDCGRLALVDETGARVLERLSRSGVVVYNAGPELEARLAARPGIDRALLGARSAEDALAMLQLPEHGDKAAEPLLSAGGV